MTKLLQNNKWYLTSILVIFLLFLLYNGSLIRNISTALTDWLDYPLIVYIQQQNIRHFSSLDFANFGSISMYYPSPNGMYFTDILLPQSLIGVVVYQFTHNYITTHNIVFLILGLINIISLHYFWSKLFRDKRIVVLLSLLFTFSPYVFSMYYHYQMISYCFFFFSLGKLLSAKTNRDYFTSGLLSGTQFIAGVYLGIYSITISGLFFLWQLYFKRKVIESVKNSFVFLIGFVVIAGYFVFQYAQVQKTYQIERPAEVYVNSSMQISDFLFNSSQSIWTENFYHKINVYNHRIGSEVFWTGFIFLLTSMYGMYLLVKLKVKPKRKCIVGFMILLFVWGIIAAMGPRLAINGNYFGTPLPYILPLKLTPFFTALRVVSRWFFVVQIGLIFFTGITLSEIFKRHTFKSAIGIVLILATVYIIEIVPIKRREINNSYQTYPYEILKDKCSYDQTVLEYPFTPEIKTTHVGITLNYWVEMLLNAMHYDCQLVNGYSGFQPKHIDMFIDDFTSELKKGADPESMKKLLEKKTIKYIKINKEVVLPQTIQKIEQRFTADDYEIVLNDEDYLLLMVK